MASYRYERDIDPKDIAPRKERQYTRKERWANWWDYNLKWVIINQPDRPFEGADHQTV